LLESILKMEATRKANSNPLERLDALYTCVLESSPDPHLSVLWILSLQNLRGIPRSYAANMDLLLQTDPESNQAEHLFGNLHSLVKIPPPGSHAWVQYDFYHKTLFDFLRDPGRCGELYVEQSRISVFIWDRFVQVCKSKSCSASVFCLG
jgi:hypothetical protein